MREPLDNMGTIVEVQPSPQKKLLLVLVIISILLGIVITAFPIIFYLERLNNANVRTELDNAKKELKLKNDTIKNLIHDTEELSSQLYSLREFAIARSNAPTTENTKTPILESNSVTPVKKTPEELKAEAAKIKEEKEQLIKQHKKETCDLVGLSAAEQMETLKRCVNLMESKPK